MTAMSHYCLELGDTLELLQRMECRGGYEAWRCPWCRETIWKPGRLARFGFPPYAHPRRALCSNLVLTFAWAVLITLAVLPALLVATFVRMTQPTLRDAVSDA